jgi:acetyl/propionyl-CoA carboxylase alpha subunit
MYFEAEIKNKPYKIDVVETRTHWKIAIQENNKDWVIHEISKSDFKKAESYISFLFQGSSYLIDVVGADTDYTVYTRGSHRVIKIHNDEMLLHKSLKDGSNLGLDKELKSGMPGKVIEIYVKAGDFVKADKPLLIMEAMKMENEMRAAADVVVKEVCVKQGDSVESGVTLIKFETKK